MHENQLFLGRNKTKKLDFVLFNRSELVIVYGRRRVGKTYLIDQFFNETYDFTFVGGHKLSQRIQLRNFAKALKKAMKERTMRKFADWFDGLMHLTRWRNILNLYHQ